MHAVSTNQIADILHFNDNINYLKWIISDIKQKGMEYFLIIVILS